MSNKYFLYTKKGGHSVSDITGCQIINPASYASMIFILPEKRIDDYYNGGIIDGQLIEWCKQFCSKEGAFLDIGAKTGVYTICLSEVSNKVYSFEQHKMDYYALCGSVALSEYDNITCFQEDFLSNSIDNHYFLNEEVPIQFIRIDLENNALNVLKGAERILKKNNYPTILIKTTTNIKNELSDFLESNLQYHIINVGGYDNLFLAVSK